jgi:hypothetical protein
VRHRAAESAAFRAVTQVKFRLWSLCKQPNMGTVQGYLSCWGLARSLAPNFQLDAAGDVYGGTRRLWISRARGPAKPPTWFTPLSIPRCLYLHYLSWTEPPVVMLTVVVTVDESSSQVAHY